MPASSNLHYAIASSKQQPVRIAAFPTRYAPLLSSPAISDYFELGVSMFIAPHILENEFLRVEIRPDLGGRITSLRSVRTREEFLLPPLREPIGNPATIAFSHGPLGGFDECLPSVSACERIADEAPVPDHGDLWRKPWIIGSDRDGLLLKVDATSRPLQLIRRATLKAETLVLEYELLNTSDSLATWLWSAHPLLQAEVGDRILLPDEVDKVEVEYASQEGFVRRSNISWPLARNISGTLVNLGLVRQEKDAIAYKLFARLGRSGQATLYRTRIEQGITFHFDPASLPFLGLWVNAGAWPEEDPDRRLTVALEPTTSSRDSLDEAAQHGVACRLEGGARQNWSIALQLLGSSSNCSLNDLTGVATRSN